MGDRLLKGEKLERGQALTSGNGAYTLTLQDDGNLVLAARGQAVWATGTNGQDVARAEVQNDGNFVLYTPYNPVWHTDTKGAKDVRKVFGSVVVHEVIVGDLVGTVAHREVPLHHDAGPPPAASLPAPAPL